MNNKVKKPLGGDLPPLLSDMDKSEFSIVKNRLKIILAEKNISQTELCEKLNISRATLSNIVNGNQNATLGTALDLSYYLKMPVNKIFYKKYHDNISELDDFELMLSNMDELFKMYKKNALTEDQIRMIYQSYVDEFIANYDYSALDVLSDEFQENYINNRFACEVLLGLPKT